MPMYEISLAASDAVVDRDFFRDRADIRGSHLWRRIAGAALTGSAAANDMVAELKVGNTLVAILRNITTGNPTNDHIQPIGVLVPPGAPVQLIITDAAATNPGITRILMEEAA